METKDTAKVALLISRRTISFLAAVYASLIIFWLMSSEQRCVALPSLIVVGIALGAMTVLWHREGLFPLFELGTMTILVTAVYVLIPLLGFLLSGLNWTILSDNRLFRLDLSPGQVGRFAWWNAGYLLSFAVIYLYKRGRVSAQGVPLVESDRLTAIALVTLILVLLIYFVGLYQLTGAKFWYSYADLEEVTATIRQLPLVVQQVSGGLFSIYILANLALVILIIQRWTQKRWRYLLFLWLGVEIVVALVQMGPRTEVVLILLASVLVYHRLIKPLKVSTIILVGALLLSGTLIYGAVRDYVLFYQLYKIKLPIAMALDKSTFSRANEFQILLGTAADLQNMKEKGTLGDIPKAIYFGDFLALIPQQLLPFAKIDPAQWYLEEIGQKGTGEGFMFGVMSQGVIGWGWPEMILRGAILGYIFAALHRWYVRHARNYWMTFFYLVMCLFSYYTYRASTFYFLFIIVHQVIPCILLVKMGRLLLTSRRTAIIAGSS